MPNLKELEQHEILMAEICAFSTFMYMFKSIMHPPPSCLFSHIDVKKTCFVSQNFYLKMFLNETSKLS